MKFVLLLAMLPAVFAPGETPAHDLAKLERSFWLNASLAAPTRGYWGPDYPSPKPPTEAEIANASKLLTGEAAATRLYLIYHGELPAAQAREVFLNWRKACPAAVELVPTLVLRMYDKPRTPVFDTGELEGLCEFFKSSLHARHIAVYDVAAGRDCGASIEMLAKRFTGGLLRIGLQPGEPLAAPFVGAVEDTWSGLCHGLSNADWGSPGFGEVTLRQWVAARNTGTVPVAWDFIIVAWDYSATKRGEYPGYDDAGKNQPLPAGRNGLAAADILATAVPGQLAGFSSDLLILELNSASQAHDGVQGSFYQTLKRGQPYQGFFARPWREITGIYQALRAGKQALHPPSNVPPAVPGTEGR